jgi:adenylosuccinate synthase
MSGLGVPPQSVNKVIGITKAYVTRVGSGPFPTELDDDIRESIRKVGQEFGATTGRPRRCGWLDLPSLKYSCMINGVDELNLMKLDVLSGFDYIKVCVGYLDTADKSYLVNVPYELNDNLIPVYKTIDGWDKDISKIYSYEDLPKECIEYIDLIESIIEIPITRISVGPDRSQTITKNPL